MNDKPWFRSTLVRKSTFDSVWEHVTERGKFIDSAPVFKGKSYLYEQVFPNPAALHDPSSYAVSEMQNATNRFQQKEDITIRVNLIVDSVGAVSIKNIVHSQSENEKKTNEIRQRLVSTSGQWAPAILNGKPISQELQLTFVNRGKVWLKLKERAIQKFERAKLHMQKQHYEAAIMFASEAISLDKNRFQFYVIRAACTIKLGDIDKYCKDVAKANALNPFVSLTNVEIVNGEPVEIKCGGR